MGQADVISIRHWGMAGWEIVSRIFIGLKVKAEALLGDAIKHHVHCATSMPAFGDCSRKF